VLPSLVSALPNRIRLFADARAAIAISSNGELRSPSPEPAPDASLFSSGGEKEDQGAEEALAITASKPAAQ
jgi:hypothetical protein